MNQWATTKAEFVEILHRQFAHMENNAARSEAIRINARRTRTTDDSDFLSWLKAEQGRANDEPALESFDKFQGYKTPREAAEELAAFIEFGESAVWDDVRQEIVLDYSRVDWSEQHRRAMPVLAGLPDADGEKWKYRNAFSIYIKAAKAIARIKEIDRHLAEFVKGNKPAKAKQEPPAPLPTLEEVTKDAANYLPRLWAALADLQPPAFDMNGNFILDRKRGQDAALYALAHALVTRRKIADGIKPERVYQILCARYGRKPTNRTDKITRGKVDFPTFRDDFLDTIQDIE